MIRLPPAEIKAAAIVDNVWTMAGADRYLLYDRHRFRAGFTHSLPGARQNRMIRRPFFDRKSCISRA
jgi:hypothetical protein